MLTLKKDIFKKVCPISVGSKKNIIFFQKMFNINKKFRSILPENTDLLEKGEEVEVVLFKPLGHGKT